MPTLRLLPNLKGFVRMNPLNILAKFEVCSFTRSWDNREYFKNFGSPWIRQRSLFSQIFKSLGPINAVNIPAKFEVRSFTRFWDNRGYWKNLGRPWIRPRCLFSQMFKRLLFACTKFELCSFTRSSDKRGYWTNYVMTSILTSPSLHGLSVWTFGRTMQ